jgi:hypothetical protein
MSIDKHEDFLLIIDQVHHPKKYIFFYLSEKLRVIVAVFFETVLQLLKVLVLFVALRAHAFVLVQASLMERMHAQKVNGGQIQSFTAVRALHLLEDTSTTLY